MAELESRFLRGAAGLVEPADQARRAEGVRSDHRSEGGISRNRAPQHMERGPGNEDRLGIRAKPEEISADRAGHAGPVYSAKLNHSLRETSSRVRAEKGERINGQEANSVGECCHCWG